MVKDENNNIKVNVVQSNTKKCQTTKKRITFLKNECLLWIYK